ncbi:MAG: hypothetical protein H6562_15880 [Lewinellaceae bacterium]|nr:hypothetical protein [Lewinellaceae bacterium]
MHDIEPHYHWRDEYVASEDKQSPFYRRKYDEFRFKNRVYNYFIHPQWDEFGSSTLYLKVLFADYDEGFAIIELIGEWNDCLHNDIKFLKREVIDPMVETGIYKYILICENVLNFHGSDDSYYEEWYEDVAENDGWISFLNTLKHVEEEMRDSRLRPYVHFGELYNDLNWRPHKPQTVFEVIEGLTQKKVRRLY